MMRLFQILMCFLLYTPSLSLAAEHLSLVQFLEQARTQNLTLKIDTAESAAAEADSGNIAIPTPMVGTSQMQMETGSKANGFEISQTIPFPTKVTNDRSARKYQAQAKAAQKKNTETEVVAQARFIYFKIWQTQERLNLLGERKSAIERHLKLSTAAARSDSFMKVHLLKTESDLDMLDNDLIQAEQNHRDSIIQAAMFLDRNPKQFDPVVDSLTLSTLPKEESLNSPYRLEVKKYQLQELQARESEAKSSWLPDFNLKYREMERTSMIPQYSEVMVSMSLPFVFFWGPNSASNKATAERSGAEYRLQLEKRNVESAVTSVYSRAKNLKQQIDLINEKLIPRAEKRMRLLHNLAPRDMETLIEHREVLEEIPNLKLKLLELRSLYEESVMQLQVFSRGAQE